MVHLLLLVWLLREASDGVYGSDRGYQSDGSALQVTFVSLLPSVPPTSVIPFSAQQSHIVPGSPTGLDIKAKRAERVASKFSKVLTEADEEPSVPHGSQGQARQSIREQ